MVPKIPVCKQVACLQSKGDGVLQNQFFSGLFRHSESAAQHIHRRVFRREFGRVVGRTRFRPWQFNDWVTGVGNRNESMAVFTSQWSGEEWKLVKR